MEDNNKVAKSFSEMTVPERIKKLEKRNLNFKKEQREVIDIVDKVWYINATRENQILIGNLRLSL